MKRMNFPVLALAVLSSVAVVTSCNKKVNSEIDQILANEPKKPYATTNKKFAEESTATKGATGAAAAAVPEGNVPLPPAAEKAKAYDLAGQYDQAIKAGEGSSDPWVRYFVAIGHYGRMCSPERYPTEARIASRDTAIQMLREISGEARDEGLKARATLWYGQALVLMYAGLAQNQEAIKAFQTIQSQYKDSDVYNDAILFEARAWTKIGIYVNALSNYVRLGRENLRTDRVYDPELQYSVDVRKASTNGILRIYQISVAGAKDRANSGR